MELVLPLQEIMQDQVAMTSGEARVQKPLVKCSGSNPSRAGGAMAHCPLGMGARPYPVVVRLGTP